MSMVISDSRVGEYPNYISFIFVSYWATWIKLFIFWRPSWILHIQGLPK